MADERPPTKKRDRDRGQDRDPGAPVGKDELDPELVNLRGPRAQVGALTALAICAVCVVYLGRLFGDFMFSRGGDHPREVTAAQVVAGEVGTDELVQLTVALERSAAARLRNGPGDPGVRVAPVEGAADKLWVALPGDGWEPSVDGKYRGRLHHLDGGPMGPALRDWQATPQPRFVAGDELRRARLASADGGNVAAISGPPIAARGDTPVEVAVVDPASARVVVTFIERLPDARAWGDALAKAGVIAAGTPPATTANDRAAWDVHAPGAVAATEKLLLAAQLWASRVDPVTARQKTTWKDLAADGDGVTIGGAKLPWSAVDVVALWAPRPLPDGAYVLVVDEKPSDFWAVKPLFGALAVIGLLFAWALWRAVRRDLLPVS